MKNKIDGETELILKELAFYKAGIKGLPRKLTYDEIVDLLNNVFREITSLLFKFNIDWRDYTGDKKKKVLREPEKESEQEK